ncbi:hypothetical protein VOLCADRAFT_119836 [Volvox carteri f. nagariensis]|uniref:PUB domain-containing protein n=1 Tax=Volvox carteri f. nagariensis TaxID=3068 RepID=D8UHE8_VOLCA|nr:uncharacterized protein VOLCADRAFT_119836 [Volvox carteri f. nagariensis]EFJ40841.1 hypothetical protein VOLCADRAFT_119836 [Volvox carteri f. nagariensis]|eukprot:XP_002958110.1 hypothetical protein VOLCADRAFT_119836 [Volvox carteri f. nagariensis]
MSNLEAVLIAKGINADVAKACSLLFGSYEEALPFIDPPVLPGDIKEYYSLKYHRYYYHCSTTDITTWELPPQLQLSEWLLDASTTGMDVRQCRKLLSAVLRAVQTNAHKGESLWTALTLLGRLTGNIVGCGNTVEKYRTVRTSNPKIREALDVVPGAEAVLLAAGFRHGGSDTLAFPPPGDEGGAMRALMAVNAKLHQLISRKVGRDGSDRLVTRKHDAPRGEFRYECELCPGYNLCEACWDQFMSDTLSPAHARDHPFHTHHPKASQHNLRSNVSDSNPWGVLVAGGSAARARERLKQRTGL